MSGCWSGPRRGPTSTHAGAAGAGRGSVPVPVEAHHRVLHRGEEAFDGVAAAQGDFLALDHRALEAVPDRPPDAFRQRVRVELDVQVDPLDPALRGAAELGTGRDAVLE